MPPGLAQAFYNSYTWFGLTMADTTALHRKLPSVDKLLQKEEFRSLLGQYPRSLVLQQVQQCLADLRLEIEGGLDETRLEERLSRMEQTIAERVRRSTTPSLRRVINATGVVIHTNLGRSPVAGEAINFLHAIA